MKIPVFLWRFQPFHSGHKSIVEKILEQYPHMTLIIGSSNISGTEANPWSYIERLSIITDNISEVLLEKITIYPLADVPSDDDWCQNLKEIIPHNSILFTGNEWVRDICMRHNIETEHIIPTIDISGTRIRDMIRNGEDVSQWTHIS